MDLPVPDGALAQPTRAQIFSFLVERRAPAGTEEVIQPHLDPSWELFHQGRQCCVRAPRFDDLLELQRLSGQTALQLRPANLEDVYLKLTGSELSDDE